MTQNRVRTPSTALIHFWSLLALSLSGITATVADYTKAINTAKHM